MNTWSIYGLASRGGSKKPKTRASTSDKVGRCPAASNMSSGPLALLKLTLARNEFHRFGTRSLVFYLHTGSSFSLNRERNSARLPVECNRDHKPGLCIHRRDALRLDERRGSREGRSSGTPVHRSCPRCAQNVYEIRPSSFWPSGSAPGHGQFVACCFVFLLKSFSGQVPTPAKLRSLRDDCQRSLSSVWLDELR